jgi:hypothetical protein
MRTAAKALKIAASSSECGFAGSSGSGGGLGGGGPDVPRDGGAVWIASTEGGSG